MPTTYGETAAIELGRRVATEMDAARDRTPDSLADTRSKCGFNLC